MVLDPLDALLSDIRRMLETTIPNRCPLNALGSYDNRFQNERVQIAFASPNLRAVDDRAVFRLYQGRRSEDDASARRHANLCFVHLTSIGGHQID